MLLLLVVSFIWAFSFGLTKGQLAGVDSTVISVVRLALALLVFLPFVRGRALTWPLSAALMAIGAVQFGVMYLALNESYRYLQAYEIVLLTLTTPVLVTLLADVVERTFRVRALAAALLSILGAALVALKSADLKLTLLGVCLVQLSNAAFAVGQVWYRHVRRTHGGLRDREIFALLYAGAVVVAALAMFLRVDVRVVSLTPRQIATLVYLGVLASGVGFFLWNVGATRVRAGTLAVMNNAKVPLGVACSLLFFGERAHLPSLLGSLAALGAAIWMAQR